MPAYFRALQSTKVLLCPFHCGTEKQIGSSTLEFISVLLVAPRCASKNIIKSVYSSRASKTLPPSARGRPFQRHRPPSPRHPRSPTPRNPSSSSLFTRSLSFRPQSFNAFVDERRYRLRGNSFLWFSFNDFLLIAADQYESRKNDNFEVIRKKIPRITAAMELKLKQTLKDHRFN